ncbi:MAG: acetoin utilization protein, partial [Paenibacillus sp. RIFOXYA1_FULL_44_5]
MEHTKIYHSTHFQHHELEVIIEGPIQPELLQTLTMHEQLDAFRPPAEQLAALEEIARLPEGRIIIARDSSMIIGYVTFHYPDELERWSEGDMSDLIELGAVEVANDYRSLGLGKRMIQLAFLENQMESYIVYTTEYYWHWDLQGSGLDVWEYREIMVKLM